MSKYFPDQYITRIMITLTPTMFYKFTYIYYYITLHNITQIEYYLNWFKNIDIKNFVK